MNYGEVKGQIKEKLASKPNFDDSRNLLELGLNSLQIMRLVNQWRKEGVSVSFGELMEEPTLEKWWTILKGKGEIPPKQKTTAPGPAPKGKAFPLTDVQYAYWIGRNDDQILGGIGCHVYLEFDGKGVDPVRLEQAWNTLQQHHPMLRARFLTDGQQEIMPEPYEEKIAVFDLQNCQDVDNKLQEIRAGVSHRKLKVEDGQVAGIALSILPGGKTRLHFDLDLLVADVQSIQILIRDLATAFQREILPENSRNWNFGAYLDEQGQEERLSRQKAEAYWQERLPALPGGPQLPLAKRPEELKQVQFSRRIVLIPKEKWQCLQRKAAAHQTTSAVLLLTAYALVLERWSSTSHFLINIPLFNRQTVRKGLEDVVADFTTLLLLEADCRNKPSFLEVLQRIQKQLHRDVEYAAYSGVQVQRDLSQLRGGRQSAAPVVFACNLGTPLVNQHFRQTIGELSYMISQTPQVWLDFQTYEDEDGLTLAWDAVDALFPPGMVDEMMKSLEILLQDLTTESWDRAFNLLPVAQKNFLEQEIKTTKAENPKGIHEGFLARALENPERIALIDAGKRVELTYGELKGKALSVAAAIVKRGIKGQPIALTLPRGYEQIVAVLGILISGNHYVPITLSQPKDRRRLIHEKTGIHFVLTNKALQADCPVPIAVWDLEEFMKDEHLAAYPEVRPEDSAYIIMTSGSTGIPKGVEITHRSAWNTVEDINEKYQINEEDAVLCVSAMDFDLSVYDVFGILGKGGRLVLIPEEKERDAGFWLEQILDYGIRVWNSAPVLLDMLLVYAEAKKVALPLRLVFLSGDWIGLDLPERLARHTEGCQFIGLGGATEASIWSNHQKVELPLPKDWKSIPYGRPLKHQAYRVVDENGRDCPCWVEGELWIGGEGVAKGYRGDSELTRLKFIEDSYGRWYRTGDRGRFWADGTIEFLGRKDNQVKIRGHRIELREIEQAIRQCAGVKNAVVEAAGEKKGDNYLAAYVEVAEDENSFLAGAESKKDENKWVPIGEIAAQDEPSGDLQDEFSRYIAYANGRSMGIIWNTLRQAGAFKEKDKFYNMHDVMERGRIAKKQGELIRRWLFLLQLEGCLQERDGSYRFVQAPTEPENFKVKGKEQIDQYCQVLQEHTVGLLQGNEEAIEVFYQNRQEIAPYNLLKRIPGYEEHLAVFLQYFKQLAQLYLTDKPLRILEIGTRDSYATGQIHNALQGLSVEYVYGDTSPFFIDEIKSRIHDAVTVEFKRLNLEESVVEQGYSPHFFDCIIAVNSLHRSHHVQESMKQITRLLAPAGVLLMTEFTAETYLQEITAAFLEEGFKNLEDVRKENRSAVVQVAEWKGILERNGFAVIRVHPQIWGRSILAAQYKSAGIACTPQRLQEQISLKLPEYMVPRIYYFLERLPLTANGKLDRKKLQATFQPPASSPGKRAAATETESKLLQIWQDIFHMDNLGVTDNYFSLGGDSLVATRILAAVQKTFAVKLSIGAVFEKPTVRELAAALEKAETGKAGVQLSEITPDPERTNEPFPLTEVQYAYWIGRRGLYHLGNVATHCYFELDTEKLDFSRLQAAWNVLVRRHGMMRAIILADGRQQILREVPDYMIKVWDLVGLPKEEQAKALEKTRSAMSHHVLRTDCWPLFDVQMSVLNREKGRLHISFDNIILDGWSMFRVLNEWAEIYRAGKGADMELSLSFRDYVLELERIKSSRIYEEDKQYWKKRIHELAPAPELPLARSEGDLKNQRFQRRTGSLSQNEWACLKSRAKEYGITPSVLLLTAYAEVLRLWSYQPDFTINLTQFDRKPLHPQVEKIVGDFTTLTLLEIKADLNSSFSVRAKDIQRQLTRDLEHSFYSAVEVQRDLKKISGNTKGAIMPIVFTSGLGVEQWSERKWLGSLVYNISQTPQVWLDHQVIEKDGELCLFWDALDELFYPGMLDEMFGAYTRLLKNLAANSHLFGQKTPTLVNAEISSQRREANQTVRELAQETLDDMFLKAASRYAQKEAVITPERRMTYRELKEEAFYLCRELQSRHVQKGEKIAILMEKGWEQIVAAYGILLAGAAYLPLDPQNPRERLEQILKDSGVRIVLVQENIFRRNQWLAEWNCLAVRAGNRASEARPAGNTPSTLAYVIYTSGTTGVPKGVMITHGGAVNTIHAINRRYNVTHQDEILGLSNLHFDLSVYDIFGVLGVGGTLVIPDHQRAKDPLHWIELMNREKITLWNSVPALMEMLMEFEQQQKKLHSNYLRLVLLSGDWIPLNLPGKIRTCWAEVQIIALGGATEASIWSNALEIPAEIPATWKSIPYGKPLDNQKYFVLNPMLEDCPDWVAGVLYIAGKGVALGYLNDEQKSKEKFIVHPGTRERIYCTGDRGRYWPDGNIEFLGRADSQVKINGYRVELGEIESTIKQLPGIRDAVVTVSQAHSKKGRIISFLCMEEGNAYCSIESNPPGNETVFLKTLHESAPKAALEEIKKTGKMNDFNQHIEQLCAVVIYETLCRMGIAELEGGFTGDRLLEKLHIQSSFSKLLSIWLDLLAQNGYLQKRNEKYSHKQREKAVIPEKEELRMKQLRILQDDLFHNIPATIKIMRGEKSVPEILASRQFLLEAKALQKYDLYQSFFAECLKKVFRICVQEKEAPICLELGTRMASQTEEFLRILGGKGKYLYNDESSTYLEQMKGKYAGYPNFAAEDEFDFRQERFVRVKSEHSVDIIVADNTLHRAYNLHVTLENIKKMLRPGGILIIHEYTKSNALMMSTVAFLEDGFSRITDERKSQGSPLLMEREWADLLKKHGFSWSVILPEGSENEGQGVGESIIVARIPPKIAVFDEKIFSEHLNKHLPDYMMPGEVYQIQEMPLSVNGKIDREKLNRLIDDKGVSQDIFRSDDMEVMTNLEQKIAKVWGMVLDTKISSKYDNFFQNGGDSLKAIRLINGLKKTYGLEIQLSWLFEAPNIYLLAKKSQENKSAQVFRTEGEL